MPAIPVVDITIPLFDTGYNFRFTEADTSTTLGQFGFQHQGPLQPPGQGTVNWNRSVASFPGYNTLGSPMTPALQNFTLQPHAKTGHGISGSLPVTTLLSFDGLNFLQITWDNVTGVIEAKLTTWPGAIDYSSAGMVNLNITNLPALNTSPGGISPVIFADGSRGFVIWALNERGAGGVNELLAVTLDLAAATTWIPDPRPVIIDSFPTTSFPTAGANYMATLVNAPTLDIYLNVYTLVGPTMTVTQTLSFSGDISNDAVNGLLPNFGAGDPIAGFYYTPDFLFGIDWNSGNFTGCWYCRYDCTAYGNVTFPMPDASTGPSSSLTQYWVNDFYNNLPPSAAATQFEFYPNWDIAGTVWWIRVPLVDGGGNYVLEVLSGEVYTSLAAPPAAGGQLLGTFVGFIAPGQFSGGSK